MTENNRREQHENTVLKALPEATNDLARLRVLAQAGPEPVVTVIGKYNHGKSQLLNELLGQAHFSVADKRETVSLTPYQHEGVVWLDAPGLDADVAQNDDDYADQAAWLLADIRLLVHAAKEGELDAAEQELALRLQKDQKQTQRQVLFVMSQIDQLADDAQWQHISSMIAAQVPGLPQHPVSSTRYRLGVQSGKALLVQKSGLPDLKEQLNGACQRVPQARQFEQTQRFERLQTLLQDQSATLEQEWHDLVNRQTAAREDFDQQMRQTLLAIEQDMQPVVNHQGEDAALVPDKASDMLKVTAGKLERSRLQIAYSRACMKINACLIRHGAIGIPKSQHTVTTAMNTIIVAVFGVSVKYREDLRRLFCQEKGRNHLLADFARYFELSEPRQALLARIEQVQQLRQDTEQAQQALQILKG